MRLPYLVGTMIELEDGGLAHDPFATLDEEGVGELMRTAVERSEAGRGP